MSYVDPNFKSKADLKRAVAAGDELHTYNPSGLHPTQQNGPDVIEGPHYPQPHRWYARVQVVNGIIAKVIA